MNEPDDHILDGLVWIRLLPVESATEEQVDLVRSIEPLTDGNRGRIRLLLREGTARVGPVRTENARGFAELLYDPIGLEWEIAPFSQKELMNTSARRPRSAPSPASQFVSLIRDRRANAEVPADPVERLILDHKCGVGTVALQQGLMGLAEEHPQRIAALLEKTLDELPDGAFFLPAALALLEIDDFPRILGRILSSLGGNPDSRSARILLEGLALQRPSALHSRLGEIFELTHRDATSGVRYAWRESGRLHLDFLRRVVEQEGTASPRAVMAWRCMLETRDESVVRVAMELNESLGPLLPTYSIDQTGLSSVDFELEKGAVRKLYADRVYHLALSEHLLRLRPGRDLEKRHPTWRFDRSGVSPLRFGGTTNTRCGLCEEMLHHIVTLDPVPEGVGIGAIERLVLATCMSCIGWEEPVLCYEHDESGVPKAVACISGREPEMPAEPLEEGEAWLVETPARWRWQDDIDSDGENLFRIGGAPAWVQSAEFPTCCGCQRTMCFLLSIDSWLPNASGEAWYWGDAGTAYIHWCDDCRISAFHWQCS